MSDSVREKILQNIVTTLQGITTGNGYTNTIALVERLEQGGQSEAAIPSIVIIEGEEESKWGASPMIDSTLPIYLVMRTQHNKSVDPRSTSEVVNSIVGDIKKAIFADLNRGGYASNTNPKGTSPVLVQEKGEGVETTLAIEVQYSHPYDDPTTAM